MAESLGNLWSRIRGFFRALPAQAAAARHVRRRTASVVARLSRDGAVDRAATRLPRLRARRARRTAGRWRRHPLLVLLHGCRQTPEDIAAGTRIARLADRDDMLVLLPRQNPRANPWGCWNWFDPATARGWGETAIVAAQIRAVRRAYRIDKRRVFVAGMSSGGALAAALGDAPARPRRRRVRPFGRRLRRGLVAVCGARRAEAGRRHRRRGDRRAKCARAADPARAAGAARRRPGRRRRRRRADQRRAARPPVPRAQRPSGGPRGRCRCVAAGRPHRRASNSRRTHGDDERLERRRPARRRGTSRSTGSGTRGAAATRPTRGATRRSRSRAGCSADFVRGDWH